MFLKVLWYVCQHNYVVWRFLETFICNKITRNYNKLCPIPNLHRGIYLLVSLLQLVEFASYSEKCHRFDWKSCRELEPSFHCPFQFWGCLEYHQRVDNAIQQIKLSSSRYMKVFTKRWTIHWKEISPGDSIIRLNNRDHKRKMHRFWMMQKHCFGCLWVGLSLISFSATCMSNISYASPSPSHTGKSSRNWRELI